MGTDIHLEAERQLDDGTWDRIMHMSEPCWKCGEYDRESNDRRYINQTGLQNVWAMGDELRPDDVIIREFTPEYDGKRHCMLERTEPCDQCQGTKISHHSQFFSDRNYDVFAILGNVRNGTGFAGSVTSSGFEPISDNRGIPDDISRGLRDYLVRTGYDLIDGKLEYNRDDEEEDDLYEEMEKEPEGYWGLGDHSWSWVTLDEIINYDWDRAVVKEGWVTPGQFQHFREHGSPNGWCGGVSGRNVEHISDTEMALKIDEGDIQFDDDTEVSPFDGRPYTTGLQRAMGDWNLPEGSTGSMIRDRQSLYCHIKWPQHYRECVGATFWQQVEYLKELAPHGDYSRIRLVFGFDS